MKTKMLCLAAAAAVCLGLTAAGNKVTIGEGDGAVVYNLAATDDAEGVKGAKAYVDAYADNVQADKEFKAHEAAALETVRQSEPLYGTWWAILPPLIAILLALITKEVYSSLFLGIVAILPAFARSFGISQNFAQFFGGTSLLIMVGVVLDTLQQIESHLMMHHYDGLMKDGKIKGRTTGSAY